MSVVHSFEPSAVPLVRLELQSADVDVTTDDGLLVDVEVVPLRDDDASREAAEAIQVELRDRGRPEILVRQPKRSGRGFLGLREPAIAIRVRCPEGSAVSCSSGSSDLRARGTLGDLEVKTGSGDVVAQLVQGSLRIGTASGDVEVEAVHGDANVTTASGDVDVREAHGRLAVNVVSGDLSIGVAHAGANLGSVSGDVQLLELRGGDVKVQSVSGDVDLGVGPGLALWLDVSSVSGSTSSDLELGDTPAAAGEPVELRARTVSGDISIGRGRGSV